MLEGLDVLVVQTEPALEQHQRILLGTASSAVGDRHPRGRRVREAGVGWAQDRHIELLRWGRAEHRPRDVFRRMEDASDGPRGGDFARVRAPIGPQYRGEKIENHAGCRVHRARKRRTSAAHSHHPKTGDVCIAGKGDSTLAGLWGRMARGVPRGSRSRKDMSSIEQPEGNSAAATDSSSSGPPPGMPPLPQEADIAFVKSLRQVGLLAELSDGLLEVLLESVEPKDEDGRRLDLLEMYYGAGGEQATAVRRVKADRFFIHHDSEAVTAHELVRRLSALMPEVGPIALERIGADDGPLVLRAKHHFSAVTDEYEDDLDTGEVDLTELEPEAVTITVRGLVRAMNVLLERNGVRERLVQLRSDGAREAYAAVGVSEAMGLCRARCLEDEDPERVMEDAAW